MCDQIPTDIDSNTELVAPFRCFSSVLVNGMAPKSALLTAGLDDLQKKTGPPANIPWTTREKLADIEAKKSRPLVKQSLPPPGEMTEEANLPKKKKWSRPKPRTTREKIKDADAKRRATEGGPAKSKSKDSKNDAKAQKYSVYKAIQSQHIASTHQDKSKARKQPLRPSVLMRPTERAKRSRLENKKVYEARMPNNLRASIGRLPIGNQQGTTRPTFTSSDPILEARVTEDPGASDAKCQRTDELEVGVTHPDTNKISSSGSSESSETSLDWTRFRIMDLSEAVRKRIWEFCVVYPNCFVWPEEKIDHEQPDLAMVNRRIRSEVLPIYYGKNRFAIALIPSTRPKSDSKNELNIRGLAAVEKWSAIIEVSMQRPAGPSNLEDEAHT